MKVLICGGRKFEDWQSFEKAMDSIAMSYFSIDTSVDIFDPAAQLTIIHGDAKGADAFGAAWGYAKGAKVEAYPADWFLHGKRAGYLRNKQMLEEGKPDLVVAFPGGKGTAMMVDLAIKAKVLTLKVEIEGDAILVNELNQKPIELQTEKYRQIYIQQVGKLRVLTPGQKAGIYRDLIAEEKKWLATMGAEYDDIMQAVEAMDKTQS